jgi:hypothetical protein
MNKTQQLKMLWRELLGKQIPILDQQFIKTDVKLRRTKRLLGERVKKLVPLLTSKGKGSIT